MRKKIPIFLLLCVCVANTGCQPANVGTPTMPRAGSDSNPTTTHAHTPEVQPICVPNINTISPPFLWTEYSSDIVGDVIYKIIVTPNEVIWFFSDQGVTEYHDGSWTNYTNISGYSGFPEIQYAIDPDDNLWISTKGNGLLFFDGESWANVNESDGLPENNVTVLAIAPDGILWGGTENNGVFSFDGENWTVYDIADGLPDSSITTLVLSSTGSVWVGTQSGDLLRYDGQNWRNYHIVIGNDAENNFITSIAISPNGSLWIGSRAGLILFKDEVQAFYSSSWENYQPVNDIAIDSDGTVWFSVSDSGLFHILETENMGEMDLWGEPSGWEYYNSDNGLSDNWISDITIDAHGGIWAGTFNHGLSYFDGISWTSFVPNLPCGRIWNIAATVDGDIWVGTGGGAIRFFLP